MISSITPGKPVKDTTVIWRFMDYEKFLHLLVEQSLYFARPDQFEDKNEGMLGMNDIYDMAFTSFNRESVQKSLEEYRKSIEDVGVSCWYCRKKESLPMWKLYASGKLGIAMKTTVGKLKASLYKLEEEFYLGRIDYSEKKYKGIKDQTRLDRLFTKDLFYKAEDELRVVVQLDSNKNKEERQFIPIDLLNLVDKIVISPYASSSTYRVICDIVQKYGIHSAKVEKSTALNSREEDFKRTQIDFLEDHPELIEMLNNLTKS